MKTKLEPRYHHYLYFTPMEAMAVDHIPETSTYRGTWDKGGGQPGREQHFRLLISVSHTECLLEHSVFDDAEYCCFFKPSSSIRSLGDQ
ncbi:hypothetical protein M513_10886, partial [Trichuris suis]